MIANRKIDVEKVAQDVARDLFYYLHTSRTVV